MADATGMLASTLCLLHCLALPLLVAAFPLLGVRSGGDAGGDGFHGLMVGVALASALVALAPGYLAHRRAAIALFGAAGLVCLALGAFVVGPRYGEAAETATTIVGALLLCAAHLRNRACCRACIAA